MIKGTLHIAGVPVELDREATYDILTTLSELHGRRCAEIGKCHDMEEANALAVSLTPLTIAYNAAERVAAVIDDRDTNLVPTNA